MWCYYCNAVVVYIDQRRFQQCEPIRQNTGRCIGTTYYELFGRGLKDPFYVCPAPACLAWRANLTDVQLEALSAVFQISLRDVEEHSAGEIAARGRAERERADRAARHDWTENQWASHQAVARERSQRLRNEEARARHERREHDRQLREERRAEEEHQVRLALRAHDRRVREERRADEQRQDDEARWLRHGDRRRRRERR